jgi:hypothetical protein
MYRELIKNCVLGHPDRIEPGRLHTVDIEGLAYPVVVYHIDDRDRWKFKLDGSREVHAYLKSIGYPTRTGNQAMVDFDEFADLMATNMSFRHTVYAAGKVAVNLELAVIRDICDQYATVRSLAGFDVPVCAVPYQYASEAGHILLEKNHPFSVTYCDDLKLGQRRYSLRSNEGFDVSAIAKQFGGGGRTTTAGFVTAIDRPFVFE